MIIHKTLLNSMNKKALHERVFGRSKEVGQLMENGRWHKRHMEKLSKEIIETEIEFNKLGEQE